MFVRGRSGKVDCRDLLYNFLLCMKLEDATIDMPDNMSLKTQSEI